LRVFKTTGFLRMAELAASLREGVDSLKLSEATCSSPRPERRSVLVGLALFAAEAFRLAVLPVSAGALMLADTSRRLLTGADAPRSPEWVDVPVWTLWQAHRPAAISTAIAALKEKFMVVTLSLAAVCPNFGHAPELK
jgi:hypothetical protein